jgi:hypothetical protein
VTGEKRGEGPLDDDDAPILEVASLFEADELDKYLDIREAMHKKEKEFDVRVHDFETSICRPYVHVKPLYDLKLGNWN